MLLNIHLHATKFYFNIEVDTSFVMVVHYNSLKIKELTLFIFNYQHKIQ